MNLWVVLVGLYEIALLAIRSYVNTCDLQWSKVVVLNFINKSIFWRQRLGRWEESTINCCCRWWQQIQRKVSVICLSLPSFTHCLMVLLTALQSDFSVRSDCYHRDCQHVFIHFYCGSGFKQWRKARSLCVLLVQYLMGCTCLLRTAGISVPFFSFFGAVQLSTG